MKRYKDPVEVFDPKLDEYRYGRDDLTIQGIAEQNDWEEYKDVDYESDMVGLTIIEPPVCWEQGRDADMCTDILGEIIP